MRSVTLAVIFAGLVSYWNIYTAPVSDVPQNPAYASMATPNPPLFSDPDDDEDQNRVSYNHRKARRRSLS